MRQRYHPVSSTVITSPTRRSMPLLRSVLALFLVACVASADELRLLDNRTISGTVQAIDDKEVTLKTADDKIVKTPVDNVLELKIRAVTGVQATTTYTDIRLVDDSILMCSKFAIKGQKVEATLLSGDSVTLDLEKVSSILR